MWPRITTKPEAAEAIDDSESRNIEEKRGRKGYKGSTVYELCLRPSIQIALRESEKERFFDPLAALDMN